MGETKPGRRNAGRAALIVRGGSAVLAERGCIPRRAGSAAAAASGVTAQQIPAALVREVRAAAGRGDTAALRAGGAGSREATSCRLLVAQVSKPAVSPISKSAGAATFGARATS